MPNHLFSMTQLYTANLICCLALSYKIAFLLVHLSRWGNEDFYGHFRCTILIDRPTCDNAMFCLAVIN